MHLHCTCGQGIPQKNQHPSQMQALDEGTAIQGGAPTCWLDLHCICVCVRQTHGQDGERLSKISSKILREIRRH